MVGGSSAEDALLAVKPSLGFRFGAEVGDELEISFLGNPMIQKEPDCSGSLVIRSYTPSPGRSEG